MTEIQLTRGMVALIDDDDLPLVDGYQWQALQGDKAGRLWYASRGIYDADAKKCSRQSMHRLITGEPDGLVVDHINGNGLDNRRCNLRVVTKSQNQHNQHATHGASRFRGVVWHSCQRKWRAQLTQSGRTVLLGSFDSEMEAALKYDAVVRDIRGEFANPNFPLEV